MNKVKLVYPVLPDIQVVQERRVTKEHLAYMDNPGTKVKEYVHVIGFLSLLLLS